MGYHEKNGVITAFGADAVLSEHAARMKAYWEAIAFVRAHDKQLMPRRRKLRLSGPKGARSVYRRLRDMHKPGVANTAYKKAVENFRLNAYTRLRTGRTRPAGYIDGTREELTAKKREVRGVIMHFEYGIRESPPFMIGTAQYNIEMPRTAPDNAKLTVMIASAKSQFKTDIARYATTHPQVRRIYEILCLRAETTTLVPFSRPVEPRVEIQVMYPKPKAKRSGIGKSKHGFDFYNYTISFPTNLIKRHGMLIDYSRDEHERVYKEPDYSHELRRKR